MFLIVGLGNPGKKYSHTRHNMGFLTIDEIAKQLHASWKKKTDLYADIAEIQTGEEKIILAKPDTFMNDSGKAVAALMHRFHIPPEHIIILSDDVALSFGTIRTRATGSAGGHNGLKSIIMHVGTPDFIRVRIGVDAQPPHMSLEAWVLNSFTPDEEKILPESIAKAAAITLGIVHGTIHPQTTHAFELPAP